MNILQTIGEKEETYILLAPVQNDGGCYAVVFALLHELGTNVSLFCSQYLQMLGFHCLLPL